MTTNMTRAERRRAAREQKKKKATYTLTMEQMDEMKKKFIREAKDMIWKDNAYDWIMIDLWVQHTKNGYGSKRLNRHFQDLLKEFECHQAGEVNIGEIERELSKMNLVFKRGV